MLHVHKASEENTNIHPKVEQEMQVYIQEPSPSVHTNVHYSGGNRTATTSLQVQKLQEGGFVCQLQVHHLKGYAGYAQVHNLWRKICMINRIDSCE